MCNYATPAKLLIQQYSITERLSVRCLNESFLMKANVKRYMYFHLQPVIMHLSAQLALFMTKNLLRKTVKL